VQLGYITIPMVFVINSELQSERSKARCSAKHSWQ